MTTTPIFTRTNLWAAHVIREDYRQDFDAPEIALLDAIPDDDLSDAVEDAATRDDRLHEVIHAARGHACETLLEAARTERARYADTLLRSPAITPVPGDHAYLIGKTTTGRGVFLVWGDLTETVYEACVADAENAGLRNDRYVVHSRRILLHTDDVHWVQVSGQAAA